MPDWYSEFLLTRARQREIACMAEGNRRLASSGLTRRRRANPRGKARNQLMSALLVLGRSFKSHPDASGR